MQVVISKSDEEAKKKHSRKKKEYTEYEIEAIRYKDHAFVSIEGNGQRVEVTIALPDNTRFLYIGLTGQY